MKFGKSAAGAIGSVLIGVAALTACSHGSVPTGQTKESAQQAQDQTNLENSQPLPIVFYSQERQNLIDIELAEVNDVRTTSFLIGYGHLLWSGPTIGFGIPDSASLSNPTQISWKYNSWNGGSMDDGVIDQMDPNGIYAPTTSAGTWVIGLDANGVAYINRMEDNVDTLGCPAEWDAKAYAAGEQPMKCTGAPTAIAQTGKGRDTKNTHQPGGLALSK